MQSDQHTPREAAQALLSATLAAGDSARVQVAGTCMAPLINDGDHVVIEALTGPPRRGDIVVARDAQGELVCHRVLSVSPEHLLLAGDVRGRLERPTWNDLMGRVCTIDRSAASLQVAHPPRIAQRVLAWMRLYSLRRQGQLVARVIGKLQRTASGWVG